jgi:hypothetical protein
MHDAPTGSTASRSYFGRTAEALAHLETVIIDGLGHGFFDCSITCEIIAGRKRQLVIRAGKSHKFIIPEDELPALTPRG